MFSIALLQFFATSPQDYQDAEKLQEKIKKELPECMGKVFKT